MVRLLCLTDRIDNHCPTFQSRLVADHFAQKDESSVRLISLSPPPADASNCSWIDHIDFESLWQLDRARQLVRMIRSFQPDVIHVWGDHAIESLSWIRPIIGNVQTVISHIRADFGEFRPGRMLRRMSCRNASLNLVPHTSLIKPLEKLSGGSVDLLPLGWPKVQAHGVSTYAELRDGQKQVVTCLPYEPQSRIKDVIWAAELVTCIRKDIDWLIIGRGSQEWRLKRFASQQEFGINIRFLDWNDVSESDWQRFDVMVQPSAAYSDFNAMKCAMSHEIPIIAANHELTRELLTSGHNGFLVEKGARNEIARCVNRLINRPDIAARFGENARKRIDSQFKFSSVVDALDEKYHLLCEQGQRAAVRAA